MSIRNRASLFVFVVLILALFAYAASPVAAADSKKDDKKQTKKSDEYIADKEGTMYHRKFCPMISKIKKEDKIIFKSDAEADDAGYVPCIVCMPDKN